MSCSIGVIGGGFVGSATACFSNEQISVIVYDIDPAKCVPQGVQWEDILNCTAVFICVPTPINDLDGSCDTSIVDSVIDKLNLSSYKGFVIVRSTVPVGYCKSKSVHFMPEFLTEKNWKNDFLNCSCWIIGTDDVNVYTFITDLINNSPVVNKKIEAVDTCTAELVKYFRNCFLAVKVSFCNEMEAFSRAKGCDYSVVQELVAQDTRIGLSHTFVPGHDGKRGFGGHCLPKDSYSLQAQMKDAEVESFVLSAAIKRNEIIDRPEKDW